MSYEAAGGRTQVTEDALRKLDLVDSSSSPEPLKVYEAKKGLRGGKAYDLAIPLDRDGDGNTDDLAFGDYITADDETDARIEVDVHGDGFPDATIVDTDGDGEPDTIAPTPQPRDISARQAAISDYNDSKDGGYGSDYGTSGLDKSMEYRGVRKEPTYRSRGGRGKMKY